MIIDYRARTWTDATMGAVGEIRHVLETEHGKPVRCVEFYDEGGEFAFRYRERGSTTYTFEVLVWDATGRLAARVDSKLRVWVDDVLDGAFKQERGRVVYRVAWRLCDPCGATVAELWPDRKLGFFRRSAPWHVTFDSSASPAQHLVALAAIVPIVCNYYASE